MAREKLLRRTYQKKFDAFKQNIIETPLQGWLRTIRQFLGMNMSQFADKIGVSQPRIFEMERNEKNLKISTMERIADSLNCDFVYAIVPRENIEDIIRNQARKKAEKILKKVNKNMALEKQLAISDMLVEDIVDDLIEDDISGIWDDED